MGLFGKKSGKSDQEEEEMGFGAIFDEDHSSKEPSFTSVTADEQAQEFMKDNLELMKEIVDKIREDPDFASSIYADCPRLQHFLDEHPDLRPIFEDPNLVRINFEQVYRDAGGVFPEDEKETPKYKKVLACIVNHPLFKVLKFLLLIKKILNCIFGGGFALIKNCFTSLFVDEAAEQLAEAAEGAGENAGDEIPETSPENQANKEALNRAADHMEEPRVQETMQALLEENDADGLQEAIENDPELRALRDANPLCAELMSNPDTMRILVEPDNLRALGECPELIEQDFANPNWEPPAPTDVETGGGAVNNMSGPPGTSAGASASTAVIRAAAVADTAEIVTDLDDVDIGRDAPDGPRATTTAASGADADVEYGHPDDVEADGEEGEEEALMDEEAMEEFDVGSREGVSGEFEADNNKSRSHFEDFEMDDDEGMDVGEFELGDDDGNDKRSTARSTRNPPANSRSRGGGDKSRGPEDGDAPAGSGGGGGFMAQMAAGVTDMIVSELVGGTIDDFMGGGDELDGLEDAAEGADNAEAAALAMDLAENDNFEDIEDGLDNMEDKADEAVDQTTDRSRGAKSRARSTGGAGGSDDEKEEGFGAALSGTDEEGEDFDEEEDDQPKKKKGMLRNIGSAMRTAVKEQIGAVLLGEDMAEYVVEKMEDPKKKKQTEEDMLEGGAEAVEGDEAPATRGGARRKR